MNSIDPSALRTFLEPESVAIVGASGSSGKFGNNIVRNLLTLGYKGRVHPINPKEEKIMGLKVYPRVSLIPDTIDLVVIIVPAPHAPQIMEDCAQKGVKGVHLLRKLTVKKSQPRLVFSACRQESFILFRLATSQGRATMFAN